MHESSINGMAWFRDNFLSRDKILKILDIGSMDVNGSYRDLFQNNTWIYKGMDISEGRNVDIVVANPLNWKEIPNEDYDVVISGQTLEHCEFPWVTMQEMARVLRKGGLLCVIAPQEASEHRYPVDCYRYLPDGFRALARWAMLDVKEVYRNERQTNNPAEVVDCMLVATKPFSIEENKGIAYSALV